MVNQKRIKNKLPELLVDGALTNRTYLYEYQGLRRKIRQVERKNTGLIRHYVRKINNILEELEAALKNYDIKIT